MSIRPLLSRVMQRRILIPAVVIAVVAAAAVIRSCRASKERTVTPVIGPVVDAIYALGTVKSERTYSLRLGVAAGLTDIRVSEGQEVRKGDVLVVTDSGIAFSAPFNGIVYRLYYEKGENAVPGTPVLTIIDPSLTYILVSLDQQSAVKVRRGQKAELSFEGIRTEKYYGTVERVYPSAGQFYARIRAASMPDGVLPDMNVDVAIEVSRKERAVLVPAKAVQGKKITLYRAGKKLVIPCAAVPAGEERVDVSACAVRPDDRITWSE